MEQPITVVSWNILLDKTRTSRGQVVPQLVRVGSLADTLRTKMPADIVCLQEAEQTAWSHNGADIASRLGYEQDFWVEHNLKKRRGDTIGLFGHNLQQVEAFDVGHDKQAVVAHLGGVAVVGVHLRNEQWGPIRSQQIDSVVEYARPFDSVVVMGDFNALPQEKARRKMARAGFASVFTALSMRRPGTWPTKQYREVFYPSGVPAVLQRSVNFDDIYVRGASVLDAGVFTGDSDHAGLWATVRRTGWMP